MIRASIAADSAIIARHRFPDVDADHPALASYAAWVEQALTRSLYCGWLVEQQGEVVAGAGLTLLEWGPTRDDPNPLRGRVVNVYTAPLWRRQGFARALVEHALGEAKVLGVRTVTLGATDMARPLYEALGFQANGHEMAWRG